MYHKHLACTICTFYSINSFLFDMYPICTCLDFFIDTDYSVGIDTCVFLGIYYLPSHRTGSMVMIFRENKYWINNRYHNTINWTCRDRKRLGCNSCVQTTVEGRYLKHKGYHNHDDNYTKYNFNDWFYPRLGIISAWYHLVLNAVVVWENIVSIDQCNFLLCASYTQIFKKST